MNRIYLAFVLVAVMAAPLPPQWPNTWWANFREQTVDPTLGTHNNVGTYYYNINLPAYRLDRSDGQYNPFCGVGGPYANITTACNHYVVNGNRYMHFPQQNTCFFCCNAAQGCGVLKANWMADATYIDTEVHEGVQTYKWFKQGIAQDYLYETVNSVPVNRVTISLYEEPADYIDYGPRSLTLPANIFSLPSICTVSNPANWGACQQIRG